MVYATCLRRLRNRHDAEDATQAVFIALAGKAADFPAKTVLGGWFYRAATYICGDMLRKAKRREEREMAAAIQQAGNTREPDPQAPDVDDALANLGSGDREAIVLRFLEERSFREVGVELRISEEAARKRVSRALRRLRGTLTADGVALSLVSVESLLHACLHPAPPELLAVTTRAALAGGATSPGRVALTKGATIMATTQIKGLAGAAAFVLLGGAAFVGYRVVAPTSAITVVAPTNKPISPAVDPDWKKRFMATYQLAPGQTVKLVEQVPVAERLQYWNSLSDVHGFPLARESTLMFKSNGSDLHWGSIAPSWIPLGWAIKFGAELQEWQVDRSIPHGMKFTGDWVFREKATPAEIMDALAILVSQRMGRHVRFVKRSVVRDVLLARGMYKFVPLTGYANDNTIIQLADGKKPDARFIHQEKLSYLLGLISMAKEMQVIDQTGSGDQSIRVCGESWRNVEEFVRTIEAQTSLRFDREPRQMDVWFMLNDSGTTLPAQP